MHKIVRYFQLLIFVTYLSHGFIPHHHHHEKDLSCSYDINFSHNHELCTCQLTDLHSDSEVQSNCLLCSQLDKEFHNHGLFFKEPVLAINVIFSDDAILFTSEEITEDFPIIDDFDLIADAVIQGHGLRAPPIS